MHGAIYPKITNFLNKLICFDNGEGLREKIKVIKLFKENFIDEFYSFFNLHINIKW